MELFNWGSFDLHSGAKSNFKIDCDALSDKDIETLARIISKQTTFGKVFGIPTGGDRIAKALAPMATEGVKTVLLVDDVLTSGSSMAEVRDKLKVVEGHNNIVGWVLFARGSTPSWIRSVFSMGTWV